MIYSFLWEILNKISTLSKFFSHAIIKYIQAYTYDKHYELLEK